MEVLGLDLDLILDHLMRMGIAFVLALPIAWDREQSRRNSLGLRTFPLVAVAGCGFILIGQVIAQDDAGALARVLQGMITGIGFLGGGAIVKRGLNVHGTATAASIWATAGIGAAVAVARYEIAVVLTIGTFLCLHGLVPVKEKLGHEADVAAEEADGEGADGEDGEGRDEGNDDGEEHRIRD